MTYPQAHRRPRIDLATTYATGTACCVRCHGTHRWNPIYEPDEQCCACLIAADKAAAAAKAAAKRAELRAIWDAAPTIDAGTWITDRTNPLD